MTADSNRSTAAKVMDEAIDLAIDGRSPYRSAPRSSTQALPQLVTTSSVPWTKVFRLSSSLPTAARGSPGLNS
jgi:hypothetical protein